MTLNIMSAPTEIVLHAIAGHRVGTGHFGRCAAVVEALQLLSDVSITLITDQDSAALAAAYFLSALRIRTVPDGADFASRALDALEDDGIEPALLYLDRYGVAAEWEAVCAERGVPTVILDDLGEAKQANVILRPMPDPLAPRDPNSRVMEGPAWLPLSRFIADLQSARHAPGQQPTRLNICFGGSDPTRETPGALAAVSHLPDLLIDVILGPGTDLDEAAFGNSETLRHVTFHNAPDRATLAQLLAKADIAVGAGGVMLWERLALGVPSVVITVVENQREQTEWLARKGVIHLLGKTGEVTSDDMRRAVTELMGDPDKRAAIAKAGRALIDARGAIRIAACLRSLTLTARPVTLEDADALFAWRTDPVNWRFNQSNARQPSFEDHSHWLRSQLENPDCLFRVIEDRGNAVGVVRFDICGAEARLSIFLVPASHGKRLGLPVYMAGEAALVAARADVCRIKSAIHDQNGGSLRMHLDAGFTVSRADKADWLDAVKPL